jgi:hypothetical protein
VTSVTVRPHRHARILQAVRSGGRFETLPRLASPDADAAQPETDSGRALRGSGKWPLRTPPRACHTAAAAMSAFLLALTASSTAY